VTLSERDQLLLNAYLDGELGPIEAARFDRRLAEDPSLANEVAARHALREGLRAGSLRTCPLWLFNAASWRA
jgi:anti-sigma factor RsiW